MNDTLEFPLLLSRSVEPAGSLVAIPPARLQTGVEGVGTIQRGAQEFFALLKEVDGEGLRLRNRRVVARDGRAS